MANGTINLDSFDRYRETRKVTLIGSVLDLLLGVGKIVVGFVDQSQALIADGVHSLSDLVTDFMVLFAAKHASREADEDHPYGHARIETMMTVALGLALIAIGLGLGYDAGRRLFAPSLLLHPGWMALVVAFLQNHVQVLEDDLLDPQFVGQVHIGRQFVEVFAHHHEDQHHFGNFAMAGSLDVP